MSELPSLDSNKVLKPSPVLNLSPDIDPNVVHIFTIRYRTRYNNDDLYMSGIIKPRIVYHDGEEFLCADRPTVLHKTGSVGSIRVYRDNPPSEGLFDHYLYLHSIPKERFIYRSTLDDIKETRYKYDNIVKEYLKDIPNSNIICGTEKEPKAIMFFLDKDTIDNNPDSDFGKFY